ncbi:MAG: DUF488 domain-containing protein [Chloroflexi bacterium]|nr:DUF488 domain-containing protein [Chloroflexota bacterium]
MTTQDRPSAQETVIYTIGFTQKSARDFFDLLRRAAVRRVVDIRLNNESQLAGFTKREDLEYFLRTIAGIDYRYRRELAPTKEILDGYRNKKITWTDYERHFLDLMDIRHVESSLARADMDKACLLCSEPTADRCHRRLVAEYLRSRWGNVEIRHL